MIDTDRWWGRRVAVVAAGSVTGEMGGAERFYAGLRDALAEQGCDVDLISVPTDESTFESILSNYARCRELDVSKYDLVISTKAPTYAIRHARHVVYLVHTVRVFYDMFDKAFPVPTSELLQQRRHIQRLDTAALGAVKHRFAIGHEVASRLRRWNGLDAEVLHPPLGMNRFRLGEVGDYFFLPGRLHPWKRVDLAIQAVVASSMPLRLLIAGTGEAEPELKHLAGGDGRIEFLGRVSDEKLVDYYAGCLAVLFLPIEEDYGYITLEAFSSAKAVITCRDSGEPLQFVVHGQNGWVCDPAAESIREAIEYCFEHRDVAKRFGDKGAVSIGHITWPNVARRLLESGFEPTGTEVAVSQDADRGVKVAVLDMQPIDPPVGGGRLRLLGLYHALGDDIQARYVGSYDWPGEPFRRHQLTPTLEEIDVPLSDAHHAAAQRLSTEAAGKVVIDIAFPRLGHLSASYLEVAREAVDWADVVVFSHPWVYPLVADRVRSSQLIVYDSQNVEGFLRAQLLDKRNTIEYALLREVVAAEYQVGLRADLILACSSEDKQRFARIYDWPFRKMRVLPNGVMARSISVPQPSERMAAKRALGLDLERPAAIFIGSAYGPNVDAARFIATELAPGLADVIFVVAGGVGSALHQPLPANLHVTGAIDEVTKRLWLSAGDIGINPMFSGSGTNIKMFDLMAAGLPVVTTAVGARGIKAGGQPPFVVADPTVSSFIAALRRLLADQGERTKKAKEARRCVDDGYSWERISPHLGQMLRSQRRCASKPFFSVVVPSFDRHQKLEQLMACLETQTERDFEVIVVDQSSARWPQEDVARGFPLTYVHTDVRGAVSARNTGADYAQGSVIAFTDDDCLPDKDWLFRARVRFEASDIVGVEGGIQSDHLNDPTYRPVTNLYFEGLGFMTANLFVRAEEFHHLDGFDLAFDRPHFREDTDFGWRLQEVGEVPYAPEVRVIHPAQPRNIERESLNERAKFFEKDALLAAKHPRRYRQLFELEGHWKRTEGFWENFKRGAEIYGVEISDYLSYESREDSSECNMRVDLLEELLREAESHVLLPPPPPEILGNLEQARQEVGKLSSLAAIGTHGTYFEVSTERYAHYVAAALAKLQSGSRILDVGNAPGHFAYLLTTLGHHVKGINLNAAWRGTYPDPTWLDLFEVQEVDIEAEGLPCPDQSFDALVFTEVLEHIAVKEPSLILREFLRVLVPGGLVIFSTPNVCNISNVIALLRGSNVFWQSNIFYGSLDRHNREYTPSEVAELFASVGFRNVATWGMSDHSNWRAGGTDWVYGPLAPFVDKFAMMRNTIVGIFMSNS